MKVRKYLTGNPIINAAIVENPAVMTAAGYLYDKNTLGSPNKLLAYNLSKIGEVGIATPIEGFINPYMSKWLGKVGELLFNSKRIGGIKLGDLFSDNISKSTEAPIKFNEQGIKNAYELFNELPEGNPLKLHMQRLIDSGKNIKTIRIFDITKDGIKQLFKSKGFSDLQILDKLKKLRQMKAAGSNSNRAIFLGPEYINNYKVISHELDHAVNIPKESLSTDIFNVLLPIGYDLNYFVVNNNWEAAARGSQIKDWLGKNVVTASDLKRATSLYIQQTGLNNSMKEFFSGIKNWDKMAEWLTKYSTAVSPFIIQNNYNDTK